MAGKSGDARILPGTHWFSWNERRHYRNFRAMAHFRRLVARGCVATGRVGCERPPGFFFHAKQAGFVFERARRAIPDLLRRNAAELVCTRQVRLMCAESKYTELHAR